jgi:hypothetical protein
MGPVSTRSAICATDPRDECAIPRCGAAPYAPAIPNGPLKLPVLLTEQLPAHAGCFYAGGPAASRASSRLPRTRTRITLPSRNS